MIIKIIIIVAINIITFASDRSKSLPIKDIAESPFIKNKLFFFVTPFPQYESHYNNE